MGAEDLLIDVEKENIENGKMKKKIQAENGIL